jgi:thiol-disulfide isomerase/thioredoxin
VAQGAAAAKGLAVGTPAPSFQLPSLDGRQQQLSALLSAGKPLLLLFSSAECGPCVELMSEVAQWQRTHADKLTVALVNRGKPELVRAKAADLNPAYVLLQQGNEVADAYAATGTPSAVLIGMDGKIGSPLAAGSSAIRELVTHVTQPIDPLRQLLRRAPIQLEMAQGNHPPVAKARATGLALGTVAPMIQLPNLDGTTIDVAQLRGRPTLLLFWNPNCGFCRRMVSDLQRWESQPPAAAPRLLLISTGSVEANRALGLRAPILLENGFHTGFAFGASGTPSAVLLDAQGKVASQVVVGAPGILALLEGGVNAETVAVQPRMAQPLAA